jgi:anti-sigma factor RsiW
MEPKHPHLLADELQAFLDQALDHSARKQVEEHLESCVSCREELNRFKDLLTRLEELPEVSFQKDLSAGVLTQLQEEQRLPRGLTWTLLIEAIAAGIVIGLIIPAVKSTVWAPVFLKAQMEIRAAINIFLTQLASGWVVWWAQLQLNLAQLIQPIQVPEILPGSFNSPWILILAAASVGILTNYLLLRTKAQIGKNNHNR